MLDVFFPCLGKHYYVVEVPVCIFSFYAVQRSINELLEGRRSVRDAHGHHLPLEPSAEPGGVGSRSLRNPHSVSTICRLCSSVSDCPIATSFAMASLFSGVSSFILS